MASNRPTRRISAEALEALPDGEIVKLVQEGEEQAYACLFRRYYRKTFGMAYARLHNREDAQDVVQEAFVKVYRYIGTFKGDSSFYTWLYRITANLCTDRLRQASRDARVEYVEGRGLRAAVEKGATVMGTGSIEGSNPGRSLDRKEMMSKLQQAIDELPDYHRDVIVMREIGGMSYSDMAKSMNVSKGTIMSRLFHARRKVRERLQPYLDAELGAGAPEDGAGAGSDEPSGKRS